MITKFIILDDDACYNTISVLLLKKRFPTMYADIISFTDPAEGLEYLLTFYAAAPQKAVLLLDINMPGLTGWEVVKMIEKLPDTVRRHLTVYILSAYISSSDIIKADQHLLVQNILEKPLTNHLEYIIQREQSRMDAYDSTLSGRESSLSQQSTSNLHNI